MLCFASTKESHRILFFLATCFVQHRPENTYRVGHKGATRYNISRATFRSLPILIPSGPEQRKIADCLGPLDDLIAAAGGRIDALRRHKQGLMQQLFPSLEAES